MQNNVTELTQRLLQSLDSNYNVINMPEVTEILSLLEKVAITKELLEATRLGKHVNELRRKTTNESLSRRAKELVKRWRSIFLPEPNGQLKQPQQPPQPQPTVIVEQDDSSQGRSRKRPAKDALNSSSEVSVVKRPKVNGQITEFDFSDNSNSSFKDVINYTNFKSEPKRDVILINSDSNSSIPDTCKHESGTQIDLHPPKRRGRKKGSTNHRKLVDEAETSFSNKLAVSRGNSKVKTTQELIASLQNKNSSNQLWSPCVKKEDLIEKAAKLTERVSIIDQKLNTNSNRYKNSKRNLLKPLLSEKSDRVIESGSVINDKSLLSQINQSTSSGTEEEIIVVDDFDANVKTDPEDDEKKTEEIPGVKEEDNRPKSLSVEEALALLPPIDKSVLEEYEPQPVCTCHVKENKSDFSVEEDFDINQTDKYEFILDINCPAKLDLENKYHLGYISEEKARYLHRKNIPNVNGNYSKGLPKPGPQMEERGLYVNVVPNINNEFLPKDFSGENYQKYCISEGDSVGDECVFEAERTRRPEESDTFREWHEVIERPSSDGEILRILPYCIID